MIISMEEIVEKYLNSKYENNETLKYNIETLLDTFLASKNHFLLLKSSQYIKLEKYNFLGRTAKTTLNYIIQNLSTKVKEIKSLNFFIEIIEEGSEIKKEEKNGKNIFLLPLNIAITLPLETSILITENIIDADIYTSLAKLYLKENKYQNINLALSSIGSGGSQINVQYTKSIIQELKQGICIADSDKKYPSCKLGDTAKNLKEVINNEFLNEVIILENQRELENFIPYNLLEYLCSTSANSFCKKIKNSILSDTEIKKFYNFFDVKSGIYVKDFFDPNFLEFWKEFINKIGFSNVEWALENQKILISSLDDLLSLDKSIIEKLSSKFCEGYGNKISNTFFDFLSEKKLKYLKEELEEKKLLKMDETLKNRIIIEQEEKIANYISNQKIIFEDNKDLILIVKKIIDWGACLYIPNQTTSV